MSVNYRKESEQIVISGQTYPHREAIKKLGCRFDGARKVWLVAFSEEIIQQVATLCEGLGGGRLETLAEDIGDVPAAVARRVDPIPPRSLRLHVPGKKKPDVGGGSLLAAIPARGDLENSSEGFNISPGSMAKSPEKAGLTVRELMDQVGFAVSRAFPAPVWVVGEIQNFQQRASAIYLSLAEGVEGGNKAATATASATIWSNAFRMMEQRHGREHLKGVLADGMKVRFLCQVTVYKNRGTVSLSIQDIDVSFTKGALALAREKLLKELRAKGMDQKNKQLCLTDFPFKIGLICAEGSRAETDLRDQLIVNKFCGEILFISAAAQGEQVVKEVPAAIATLASKSCDLIIITRGGGSAADLRWFDSVEVAFAVCHSTVPIIAAIGHHDDESVAELVAYQRCKTPTAAADFVTERFLLTRKRIEDLAGSLAEGLSRQVEFYTEKQARLGEQLSAAAHRAMSAYSERLLGLMSQLERGFSGHIHGQAALFDRLASNLNLAALRKLAADEAELAVFDKKITAADPTPWLKQGWTQLYGSQGLVKRVDDVEVGDSLSVRVTDGVLTVSVNDIKKSKAGV